MEIIHHKLVRDNIPEMIRARGDEAKTETVIGDYIYEELLFQKLDEEVAEVKDIQTRKSPEKILEELGDILTVVSALAVFQGFTPEELLAQQAKKDHQNGTFARRIFLVSERRKDE